MIGTGEKSSNKPTASKLTCILRAAYYALLKHGKIAGEDIHSLLSLSCRCADPGGSYYSPKEVEFSCSNTPIVFFNRRTRRSRYKYDAAAVAKAFEVLNSSRINAADGVFVTDETPSPIPLIVGCLKSPAAMVRQLRVTDSPFSPKEEEGEEGSFVDDKAEKFIRGFYEQLRRQKRWVYEY